MMSIFLSLLDIKIFASWTQGSLKNPSLILPRLVSSHFQTLGSCSHKRNAQHLRARFVSPLITIYLQGEELPGREWLISLEISGRPTEPSDLFQCLLPLAEQMWKLPLLILNRKGDAGKQLSGVLFREQIFSCAAKLC